ncbi:MAG TPA: DoxX family protein [Bryobacteraceae bacterium]|nr:DoxX family protein [Bryobacteraceae bacterium]
MDHSMAQPHQAMAGLEMPSWKTTLSWVGAILLALLFLVSGLWKLTDAPGAAVRMAQARVPQSLSLAAAIGFGIAETFTAVLLLAPRFRRWGAWLGGALLIAFMIFIGINYTALRGAECSCFPWVKRAVGPGFFIGDGVMLCLAVLAGKWAKPARSLRTAMLVLGAVTLFAAGSYGVAAMRQTGTKAPDTIMVNGKPYSLQEGQILIFYFDPECLHCLDAAKRMSKFNWGDTRIVAVPINVPQFGQGFLDDTHLKAVLSNDLPQLKKIFPFVSAPAGVALVNGREKMTLTQFEDPEPADTLKKLGFIN